MGQQQITIPGGDDKGKAPQECTTAGLRFWAAANRQDVRDACRAELDRRAKAGDQEAAQILADVAGGDAQPAARPQASPPTQRSGGLALGASIAKGGNLLESLQALEAKAILVAPTVACESLPEGAEVAISMVRADTSSPSECYRINAKKDAPPRPDDELGLGKALLHRIGRAAGVTWLRGATERTDDGRDPYLVGYRCWARVQDIDGSAHDYPGEVEVDLRDGGPQALDIVAKAKRYDRDPAKQLAEARKFIQRATLSKAMNAAIRNACGLRHAYKRRELEEKPFAVAKLLFTGRTDDPELKRLYNQILARRFLGASNLLFGTQTQQRGPITTHGEVLDPAGPDGVPFDEGEF